ncbi:hypothetical protein CYFUS_006699 [Cystobacter fuscus]|uniref:Uncharacterized protein n=1 Tax=Cystobacter fuscus TaxID=43 RepID=A0A250JBE9_9BACT|nr:hypothetical protein CYFUS_006699 [Cystobacter fuscus]
MSHLGKLLSHMQGFCQLMRKRGVPLTWLHRERIDPTGEVWLWDTATGALLYRQSLDMPFTWSEDAGGRQRERQASSLAASMKRRRGCERWARLG